MKFTFEIRIVHKTSLALMGHHSHAPRKTKILRGNQKLHGTKSS